MAEAVLRRPRMVDLNHVALEVADVEVALAFYGRIFDVRLRVASRASPFSTWVTGSSP